MSRKKLEYTLEAINRRLSEGRVKCKLLQRGDMLWAQATFPPKPTSNRPKPYQQKISLGIPASEEGLRRAEQEARLIGAELASGQFRWEKYMALDRLPESKPVSRWVAEFREWWMQTNSTSEKTWREDWQSVFKRLRQDAPLTAAAMLEVIHSTERDTRTRMDVCRKLQKLADYAKVDVDVLQFKGNYRNSMVADRQLPTDEEIAMWWSKIPNLEWQWLYGMLAAFGLRDHEAFFCEWTDDNGLMVLKGKTGPRSVFQPLYPEWVDAWDLRTIKRPPSKDIEGIYARGKLGDKVARQFRRYGIPFSPYALRHCYGIRASVSFELPVTTAASLMGHSPDIHLKRYHKHIQQKHNMDAAQRIMQRPDRPIAPIVKPPDA